MGEVFLKKRGSLMSKNGRIFGNVLGDARAENDQTMLSAAFYETSDYHALIKTKDFNVVVGRRGTGKSALYIKTSEYYTECSDCRVIQISPEESDNLLLQHTISRISDNYTITRYIMSVAWRAAIVIEIAKDLQGFYKTKKCTSYKKLSDYCSEHKLLIDRNPFPRIIEIIKAAAKDSTSAEELPSSISRITDIEKINTVVVEILQETNRTAIILLDKLDEGLVLKKIPASIVGGLAFASGKFSECGDDIYVCAYVRDNIFRLLSRFDRDFSRNIESCALRLRWDEESLFVFITNRIRKALSLNAENNLKVWNRFAHRGLKDREGFKRCLRNTLFRPRDLLALLNSAYIIATRSSRAEIIEEDIEKAAYSISQTRLNDLVKEYDEVFHGIEILIRSFEGTQATYRYDEIVAFLGLIITNADYSEIGASDLALMNSGPDAFKVLYGIGFLGIGLESNNGYSFSFDGSPVKTESLGESTSICVHPCYWSALGLGSVELEENFLSEIYDDYTAYQSTDIAETRTKMIGSLVSELPAMPMGPEGASKFEDWCLRSVRILFSGDLSNFESHPNKNAIQRRDIVATNNATKGFWKRIFDDYSSRQVVFEVKNYSDMSLEEYRQALSYSSAIYGKFIILITRTEQEGLTNIEKGWLREMYYSHNVLIFTLPAIVLNRCIGKLRSPSRFDYIEKTLAKQLDTYVRSYLSIRHTTN